MKNTTILLAVACIAFGRTFTVQNSCSFTIWPAIFTDLNAGSPALSTKTGWEAPAGSKVSFIVPDDWKSGRIWARTGCDFSTKTGIDSCVTGGCQGGLQCDANVVAHPPVTYAEFTLNANGQDHYDVSLVGGFNLPIRISNTGGCGYAECTVNLNQDCPDALKGPVDANGTVAACKSACLADLGGPPMNSPNCCTGRFALPVKCPPSGVEYYSYFKNACPNSYVYAYDESSGTALWTCPSSKKADYTVTFCPFEVQHKHPRPHDQEL
ncbi:unnamed protein product [Rhizoctonia solani]|uniref:Pathogenesis-related protein 5 n=1 Tax=Rhizoctonia solani TaxID=456999 RepID=A0A8H2WDF4_9AGAM|nr:unnamed protein product [Rhizoctonia solani]